MPDQHKEHLLLFTFNMLYELCIKHLFSCFHQSHLQRNLHPKSYIVPLLVLVVNNILTSIYRSPIIKNIRPQNLFLFNYLFLGRNPGLNSKRYNSLSRRREVALPHLKDYYHAAQIKPLINVCTQSFQSFARWKYEGSPS